MPKNTCYEFVLMFSQNNARITKKTIINMTNSKWLPEIDTWKK